MPKIFRFFSRKWRVGGILRGSECDRLFRMAPVVSVVYPCSRFQLEQFAPEVEKYAKEFGGREQDMYNLRRMTDRLLSIPDACEQQSLKDNLRRVDAKWQEVADLLKDRKRQLSDRQRIMERFVSWGLF